MSRGNLIFEIEIHFQFCEKQLTFLVLYRRKEEIIKEPKNHEQMPPAEA